jgi:uncharacterized membrane protein
MQLTPQETKLIERLRKRERRWPRNRWIFLLGGAFLLAGYGYILARIVMMLESDSFSEIPEATTLVVAVFWPKCLLGFCVGAGLIGLAIRDWHGNVHRMLLLRLLDEQQNKNERDEVVG